MPALGHVETREEKFGGRGGISRASNPSALVPAGFGAAASTTLAYSEFSWVDLVTPPQQQQPSEVKNEHTPLVRAMAGGKYGGVAGVSGR